MSMICVNVQLQISRGIFLHGEIIQVHTIHESHSTSIVIKLPRNGYSEAIKDKTQFTL